MTTKNILIISYDCDIFSASPVGAIRVMRFAKYLTRFGCKITIITRKPPRNERIKKDADLAKINFIKVPLIESSFIAKTKAFMSDRLNPQLEMAWYQAARYQIETQGVLSGIDADIVLSSSPPESSHLIGSWLRERLGKPWIADLRDLWSHDHYRSFNALRRIPLKLREKGALKNADRIITVSNKWSEFLRKEYGDRVSAITNSFDEEQHNVVKRVGQDKFRITYLGKLNSKHQDITFFLEAVKELVEENKIATRMLFGGNLAKQPAYENVKCKVIDSLKNTDLVMDNLFWIGVYPGLTCEMITYILNSFEEFIRRLEWIR